MILVSHTTIEMNKTPDEQIGQITEMLIAEREGFIIKDHRSR